MRRGIYFLLGRLLLVRFWFVQARLAPVGTHKSHFVRNSLAVVTQSQPIAAPQPLKMSGDFRMKKVLCAGVVAVAATIGLSPATRADEFTTASLEQPQAAPSINIGRIKSALSLTPRQEAYWGPVEAALRNLYRRQAQPEEGGFVSRYSHRAVSFVITSAAIQRLAVAARPLIAVLNEDQKRAASGLAQEMGLGEVMMAAMR